MKKTALISLALLALPLVASAQTLQPIKNLVVAVGGILNMLIPVLIAAAIVVFFWGLFNYIRKSAGPEAHDQGRSTMIAGLVSLFVMVSVWGIVNLAQNALGVSGSGQVNVPAIPIPQY